MSIIFIEDDGGYASRTKKNCSADATICLSVNHDSPGTKLTKKSTKEQNKLYIPLDGNDLVLTDKRINKTIDLFNIHKVKTLHFAGNGLFSMKNKWTQKELDVFVFELFTNVFFNPQLENKIEQVISGGQTGADEAGAKAAYFLGIKTTIRSPKGWKFRDENGQDIYNEKKFKSRFNIEIDYFQ